MAESKSNAGAIGVALGILAGAIALIWWKSSQASAGTKIAEAGVSNQYNTGLKTSEGKVIIEETGVDGIDNGKKVRGYVLPEKISDIKLPLTVIVRPNKDLFLQKKVGDKVTFTQKLNDELVWIDKSGAENVMWFPDLTKAALGAI